MAAVMRAAMLAQLRARVAVTRVFEGAAARGTVPFLSLREWSAGDWGTKDRAGRELRIGIVVRDEGESAARAATLAGEAEAALLSLPPVPGWRVVSAVPVRSALLNEGQAGGGAARWAALVDVRVRIMAED